MLPTLLTILTLAECLPNMLPTLLTILTLAECTPNMLPTLVTILTLAECTTDTSYHPYARGVPSRHCLPSLCLQSALPTYSRHHLSLRLCSALPTCSQHHLSLRSRSASQHAPDTTYPYASVLHP
ncbi:hypothetical protein O181_057341 [Austropuccinia psidii MF-1]|uniref:Uncharacterized protein n=1 Tax=Austropuccinia psidii MF-1 TaxID=1389203 RepID=A0A9Q3EF07_9BASI|nr:hypothetical protein [Austropuccinia psidii MF-1]